MLTPELIVAEARTWLGVPVHHQGMSRLGVDCGGFVLAVGLATGALNDGMRKDPRLAKFASYGRQPVGNFLEACEIFFEKTEEPVVGGVVAIRFVGEPRHCAIVGNHPFGGLTVIHAINKSVIEHGLDPRWMRRIVACYRFPGVSYER